MCIIGLLAVYAAVVGLFADRFPARLVTGRFDRYLPGLYVGALPTLGGLIGLFLNGLKGMLAGVGIGALIFVCLNPELPGLILQEFSIHGESMARRRISHSNRSGRGARPVTNECVARE